MQQFDVSAFVTEWIAAWNRHDLDALMAHYVADVIFTSPRAAALTGNATLHGHAALRAYWAAGIARTTRRQFTLDSYIWDAPARRLVILYQSEVDERSVRAVECFTFDADDLVRVGEALFGAEVPPTAAH